MPVTSQQWWAEIKQDSTKFNEWLRKQYHGEVTAAVRILAMADDTINADNKRVLEQIARQEEQHAAWVKELLDNRNIDPGQHDESARYWGEVSAAAITFEDKAAIATLAEGMRLERIRVGLHFRHEFLGLVIILESLAFLNLEFILDSLHGVSQFLRILCCKFLGSVRDGRIDRRLCPVDFLRGLFRTADEHENRDHDQRQYL